MAREESAESGKQDLHFKIRSNTQCDFNSNCMGWMVAGRRREKNHISLIGIEKGYDRE